MVIFECSQFTNYISLIIKHIILSWKFQFPQYIFVTQLYTILQKTIQLVWLRLYYARLRIIILYYIYNVPCNLSEYRELFCSLGRFLNRLQKYIIFIKYNIILYSAYSMIIMWYSHYSIVFNILQCTVHTHYFIKKLNNKPYNKRIRNFYNKYLYIFYQIKKYITYLKFKHSDCDINQFIIIVWRFYNIYMYIISYWKKKNSDHLLYYLYNE